MNNKQTSTQLERDKLWKEFTGLYCRLNKSNGRMGMTSKPVSKVEHDVSLIRQALTGRRL